MTSNTTAIQDKVIFAQDTKPDNDSPSVIWIDTSTAANLVKTYDGSEWQSIQKTESEILDLVGRGPNPYDAANSFGEGGISKSLTDITVSSGALVLPTLTGNTITFSDDVNSASQTVKTGFKMTPNTDLSGVQLHLSDQTSGATKAYILDANKTVLSEASIGNESAKVTTPLNNGTDYYVAVDDDGNSYTSGSITQTLPVTGTDMDITAGWTEGSGTYGDDVFSIDKVEGILGVKSGSGHVEWDKGVPTDIHEWDTATFTANEDGETVDVFVAYDDGGGWKRTNGGDPVNRNYSLREDGNISPNDNVRLEFELSRNDITNNPCVKSVYRSWLL